MKKSPLDRLPCVWHCPISSEVSRIEHHKSVYTREVETTLLGHYELTVFLKHENKDDIRAGIRDRLTTRYGWYCRVFGAWPSSLGPAFEEAYGEAYTKAAAKRYALAAVELAMKIEKADEKAYERKKLTE